MTDTNIFQNESLVEKLYVSQFIENKVQNNDIFLIQDEREFKKFYLSTRQKETWYSQEVYDFIVNYDLRMFDGANYSWLMNYMDRLVFHNVVEQPKEKKWRFLTWRF